MLAQEVVEAQKHAVQQAQPLLGRPQQELLALQNWEEGRRGGYAEGRGIARSAKKARMMLDLPKCSKGKEEGYAIMMGNSRDFFGIGSVRWYPNCSRKAVGRAVGARAQEIFTHPQQT